MLAKQWKLKQKKKSGFPSMIISALAASLLENLLAGKEIIQAP